MGDTKAVDHSAVSAARRHDSVRRARSFSLPARPHMVNICVRATDLNRRCPMPPRRPISTGVAVLEGFRVTPSCPRRGRGDGQQQILQDRRLSCSGVAAAPLGERAAGVGKIIDEASQSF